MKSTSIKVGVVIAVVAALISCKDKQVATQKTLVKDYLPQEQLVSDRGFSRGQHVSAELVCMVNDAYMGGAKQLEVPYDGKIYYGCCKMCQSRIPEDASVRQALDPYSLNKVDKAEAYIVIVGPNGEIAYFENEQNFKKFVANK
ncbi:hypothetical protein VSO92_12410 [Myroides pelagicus]|uniref:hypothetical protein n=1 Tax=Myroides pelagicus TaxID=270914 RepID=UPI002DB75F78|nr:hypothetical protein [Myroides pelagicus]MEC4114905.1 hypothetical protein [Myroides pelagicus]